MVVNAVIAVGLMGPLGYIAAAVGTSVAGWAMFFQLWRGSRGMGEAANLDNRALSRILRITLASLAMGVVLWLTEQRGVRGLLDGAGGADIIGLVVLCLTGMVAYFAIGVVLKAFTIGDLKAAFQEADGTAGGAVLRGCANSAGQGVSAGGSGP